MTVTRSGHFLFFLFIKKTAVTAGNNVEMVSLPLLPPRRGIVRRRNCACHCTSHTWRVNVPPALLARARRRAVAVCRPVTSGLQPHRAHRAWWQSAQYRPGGKSTAIMAGGRKKVCARALHWGRHPWSCGVLARLTSAPRSNAKTCRRCTRPGMTLASRWSRSMMLPPTSCSCARWARVLGTCTVRAALNPCAALLPGIPSERFFLTHLSLDPFPARVRARSSFARNQSSAHARTSGKLK